MRPSVKLFEQLALPVVPGDSLRQWHAPVARHPVSGAELEVWCELPRLDPALDAAPWLLLGECPEALPDLRHLTALRSTDTPWWSAAPVVAGDHASLQDSDLERQLDEWLQLADWLGLREFHVLAGGFGSVPALALAAREPDRVLSVVLESVFLPLRPAIRAYLERLRDADPHGFESVFGRAAEPAALNRSILEAPPAEASRACEGWEALDVVLCGAGMGGPDDSAIMRMRRALAHFMAHDFFLTPSQWCDLTDTLARGACSITVIQGLNDSLCLPSGGRLLADLVPRVRLVELPEVGHRSAGSLAASALSTAILAHRKPSARLIPWPNLRRGAR